MTTTHFAEQEGYVHFWLVHPLRLPWTADDEAYNFPTITLGDEAKVRARKHPNRTLSLSFVSAWSGAREFLMKLPPTAFPHAICVDLALREGRLTLYLEGRKVSEQAMP